MPDRQLSFPDFDGKTYDPALDHDRLSKQLGQVYAQMCDYDWWTLGELSLCLRQPEASISARMRDLRKSKFGGYTIERRRLAQGLHEYRLLRKEPSDGVHNQDT